MDGVTPTATKTREGVSPAMPVMPHDHRMDDVM